MNPHDTIVALATAPGRGGVSIIRISGSQAHDILCKIAPGWNPETPSHLLKMQRFVDSTGGEIDHALAVSMRGPNSFTGEDVVEFHCHGGPVVQRKLIDEAITLGARVAGPGEFTQRAFMNGKIDLTQAEAISDLVNANSERAHRLALDHLDGNLGKSIAGYLEKIVESMVLVEAALDFSHEEHVYQIERDEIGARVDTVLSGLRKMRDGFDTGRRQREGIRVVVVGPPNAGKSTLFNHLVGTSRAIVTPIAGTTRDYLEESLVIDGLEFRLVDTAGIRETENEVEAIGIERSLELAKIADVVVMMVDASDEDRAHESFLSLLEPAPKTLVVVNKIDIKAFDGTFEADAVVQTQLLSADGAEPVIEVLKSFSQQLSNGEGVLLSRARHFASVVRGIEALERSRAALDAAMEHELIALDLREALDALGAIVGEVTTDDILNKIFSDFCVGK